MPRCGVWVVLENRPLEDLAGALDEVFPWQRDLVGEGKPEDGDRVRDAVVLVVEATPNQVTVGHGRRVRLGRPTQEQGCRSDAVPVHRVGIHPPPGDADRPAIDRLLGVVGHALGR